MSSAFVRERDGGEAFEDLPDRPISPHTNFVTPEGLALIEAEVARHQAEFSALTPDAKADEARVTRDLHYWTARLGSAQVVEAASVEAMADEETSGKSAHFGSIVTILREGEAEQTFRIVGEDEADPAKGSISYVSPMAQALTGRSVGDVVEVNGHEAEITAIR